MAKETEKKEPVKSEFTYNGSACSHFTHDGAEYNLFPGEKYSLPSESEIVKNLIAQNRLTADKK